MFLEEPLIIPIRGTQIYYLSKEHLNNFQNVTLVSESGDKVKVNHLQLAAFSGSLFLHLDLTEPDECVVSTNLSYEDVKTVADFISEGILPQPMEQLRKEVPQSLRTLFDSFGINLSKILNNEVVKIEPELSEDIKKELFDIKLEDNYEYLEALDDFIQEHEEAEASINSKKPKKKRGRPKKEIFSDDEDQDWTPIKANKEPKQETSDETEVKKPRGRKPKSNSKLSKPERDLQNQCDKFMKKYQEFANLCVPSEENPESKAFETYHLPSGIDAYINPPKNLDKVNTVQDHVHPFPCPSCSAWLNNPYALKNHQLQYHQEHLQCPQCKFITSLDQAQDFKVHMFRHESRKHECIHCGYTNASLKLLESHFKTEGPFHNHKCTQCSTTFQNYQDYKSHVEADHLGQWTYICGLCDRTFPKISDIKDHRKEEHKNPSKASKLPSNGALKMCDLCGKEVASLASHHKLYHEEDLQKCPECPKICKTKYHLDDHIKGTHSRIPCEHCGLMIPIRRKERHIQQAHVAPEDRKYKCDHCGKGFTDRQKLNDHINTHTGERPYLCKYCGKGFANHGNQRAHIRQAHLGQKRNYRK